MASSSDNFIRHFNVGRQFELRGAVPALAAAVRAAGIYLEYW